MSLIETFTDYVLNRKSLKEYVEVRKTINERGEFNDAKLIQAEENLQRLKKKNPKFMRVCTKLWHESMPEMRDSLSNTLLISFAKS